HSSPTTTWTPGGSLTYTLSMTNGGNNPITPGLNNPVVNDNFTPSQIASSVTPSCSPAVPACGFTWSPSPKAANTSNLTNTAIAPGQTLTMTMTVPGPFTVPLQTNVLSAAMGGPN